MKRITMKVKLCIFCILILGILAACGNGAAGGGTGDQITLTFWTHANPVFEEAARMFADRYSYANPHITIIHESFPELETQLYASMAAGTTGDIVEMFGSVLRFAEGGLLLPVPESVMTVAEIESTFYAGALYNRYLNGRYYGLPAEVNVEAPGLLVNVGILRDMGIEVPQSWRDNDGPASWSEVMDLAHQLTIRSGDTMMQAGLGVVGDLEISMFLSLIFQLGGDYRDPVNSRVNFNTPYGIGAAEFMMDLITGPDAVHSAFFSPRIDGFMEGTVAMLLGAPWNTAWIDHDMPGLEYEYFNLPAFIPGSNPYFLAEGGWGYIVPTTSEHAEECWMFIRYMLEDDSQFEWAIITGNLPANMRVSEFDHFRTGEGRYVIGRAMQMVPYGKDPGTFALDTHQLVWDIGLRNLEAITTEQVSIVEGLQLMEDEANEMIARLIAGEFD